MCVSVEISFYNNAHTLADTIHSVFYLMHPWRLERQV